MRYINLTGLATVAGLVVASPASGAQSGKTDYGGSDTTAVPVGAMPTGAHGTHSWSDWPLGAGTIVNKTITVTLTNTVRFSENSDETGIHGDHSVSTGVPPSAPLRPTAATSGTSDAPLRPTAHTVAASFGMAARFTGSAGSDFALQYPISDHGLASVALGIWYFTCADGTKMTKKSSSCEAVCGCGVDGQVQCGPSGCVSAGDMQHFCFNKAFDQDWTPEVCDRRTQSIKDQGELSEADAAIEDTKSISVSSGEQNFDLQYPAKGVIPSDGGIGYNPQYNFQDGKKVTIEPSACVGACGCGADGQVRCGAFGCVSAAGMQHACSAKVVSEGQGTFSEICTCKPLSIEDRSNFGDALEERQKIQEKSIAPRAAVQCTGDLETPLTQNLCVPNYWHTWNASKCRARCRCGTRGLECDQPQDVPCFDHKLFQVNCITGYGKWRCGCSTDAATQAVEDLATIEAGKNFEIVAKEVNHDEDISLDAHVSTEVVDEEAHHEPEIALEARDSTWIMECTGAMDKPYVGYVCPNNLFLLPISRVECERYCFCDRNMMKCPSPVKICPDQGIFRATCGAAFGDFECTCKEHKNTAASDGSVARDLPKISAGKDKICAGSDMKKKEFVGYCSDGNFLEWSGEDCDRECERDGGELKCSRLSDCSTNEEVHAYCSANNNFNCGCLEDQKRQIDSTSAIVKSSTTANENSLPVSKRQDNTVPVITRTNVTTKTNSPSVSLPPVIQREAADVGAGVPATAPCVVSGTFAYNPKPKLKPKQTTHHIRAPTTLSTTTTALDSVSALERRADVVKCSSPNDKSLIPMRTCPSHSQCL